MEAQQIKTLIERALVSYSGTTTGDGAAGGTTLVCSALTALPDYNRLSVLIAEGTYAGLTADINGSTTGGTINVEPAFGGVIVSGINFHIIPRLPAYSELIDIMGSGFDTATDSLVKLKDDLVSLLATVAIDQGLIYKGTVDSIPAANQFIVAGLAGLGAGKFAGATLPWQIFVLRDQAGGSAAPQGEIQPVTAYTTGTGQFNHSAFTVALTAGDEILILHPKIAHIDFSAMEKASINTEVDNALDTAIPGSPTPDSINELIKGLGDFEGLTNFSTLLAILGIPDVAAKPLYTVLVTDLLGHATHGLVQLQADIAAIAAACALEASLTTHDTALGTHDTDIKNLLATIAGYIDTEITAIVNAIAALNDISTAQVNTEVDNALDTAIPGSPTPDSINERVKSLDDKALFSMDFWSAGQEEVEVTAGGATETLPSIVVAEVPGTFVHAYVMFKFRMIENTYEDVNKLSGATDPGNSQVIQIQDDGESGWFDAINFPDGFFTLASLAREGGDVIIGSIDVAARVDENDTYDLTWLVAKAVSDFLLFNDVQVGLRIWYSV